MCSSDLTALAVFPAEIQIPLRHKAERTENIVRWTKLGRGGHFAAMEEPDLFVADVRAFAGTLRTLVGAAVSEPAGA